MDVRVLVGDPLTHTADALAVGVFEPLAASGLPARIDQALNGELLRIMGEEGFTGRVGKTAVIHTHGKLPARRLIVVGLGPQTDRSPERLRVAAAAAVRRAQEMRLRHIAAAPLTDHGGVPIKEHGDVLRTLTQARVEGFLLGAYRFTRYQSDAPPGPERIDLLASDEAQAAIMEQGIADGRLSAQATMLARDLVNEPASVLTPSRLAEVAEAHGVEAGLRVEVLGRDAMDGLGMHAMLAVARGSAEEPRLIVMEYAPEGATRTVAFAGKGLTFDSGGLDLKSADNMVTMKEDMAGAAAVLATMVAAPQLAPPVRLLGVIGALENMPGPGAMKPGDIVRAMNGKTIEIANTDAEGRVVLADVLSYAVAQGASTIIDLATLTGGAHVALGPFAAAVFGNDQRLVDELRAAGEEAGERLWQLPLYPEFTEVIKSKVADVRNSAGRYGSAEKGAAFLQEFVGATSWAHLDIAPVAFLALDEGTNAYREKGGATGFGAATLLRYLRRLNGPA